MEQDDWADLAAKLAAMARVLIKQTTVQGTLDQVLLHAVGLVDGCENAGILTLEGRERLSTLAVTSDLVRTSDRYQQEVGEGPCFDAARTLTEAYRIADMETNVERWPRYAPRATELGIGSMMGFLLFTEEGDLGALDMYSSRPNAFTETSEQVGWILASHAAIAFSSARAHTQMRTALETRNEVGEALGIIMERYKVDEDQAFSVLRKSSQDHNIKLREVARTVVHTGQLPGPPQ